MTGSLDDSDFASPRVRVMCSRPNVSAGVNGAIGKEILRERVADRTRKTVNRVRIGATSLTALRFLNADRFPQSVFTYGAVQVLTDQTLAGGAGGRRSVRLPTAPNAPAASATHVSAGDQNASRPSHASTEYRPKPMSASAIAPVR